MRNVFTSLWDRLTGFQSLTVEQHQFNITEFLANLPGDGARGNLFQVNLTFPAWVANSALAGSTSQFVVKAAQLPGSTIGVAPLYYFGREVKLAGNRVWQDWTVQVINDENFVVRNAIDQWLNGLNDPTLNLRNPSAGTLATGYGVDAQVIQYSKTGDVLKTYAFINIWPMDLSPIEVDWGSNDQIEEFTCTWAVQNWVDTTFNQQ